MTRRPRPRRGLSLLEVLIALAVFLISYIAVWQMMKLAGDNAVELQYRNQATQLAQAKLAETAAGAVPLSSQGDTDFGDEAPGYSWSLDAEQGAVSSLWNVKVTVSRQRRDGSMLQVTVGQMMLDPAAVGSTQDVAGVSGSDTSSNDNTPSGSTPASGSTTPTGGATPTGGTTTPAKTTPAATTPAATTPAKTTPAATTPATKSGVTGTKGN